MKEDIGINPKEFQIGQIVYYIEKSHFPWMVNFGTVLEHYVDRICLQRYDFCDRRIIDGIPAQEFKTPTPWKKLPNGWNYATNLFKLEWNHAWDEVGRKTKIDDPASLRDAINLGFLVKVQDRDFGSFEVEIDSQKGWRVVRKYGDYRPYYTSIRYDKVYATYQEAQDIINTYLTELERQASLTDEEWSIEQIKDTLGAWAKAYHITDETIQQYRNWLLSLKNIEDVETRLYGKRIQWKYCQNKRWNDIEL